MSQSAYDVAQDLNDLLSGCSMGITTYLDYLQHVQSERLKTTLNHAIDVFRNHEKSIQNHIHAINGNVEPTFKLSAAVAEFFEKVKAELASSDDQLLDYALNGIDMGLKATHDFKIRHHGLQHDCLESVNQLESDYKMIYHELTQIKLN